MALGVGDVIKTTVNFTLGNGVAYQNVYQHIFDGIGGISDAAVVTDIGNFMTQMYGEIESSVRSDVIEQLSSVDQIEWVVDKWEIVKNIGTFTITWTGGSAADHLPNQASPFIVFKTARPKSVGRKFLFPWGEAEQAQGILTGGAITKLVAFADDAVNVNSLDVANDLIPGVARVGVNDWL
ncbi:MAG: hypothetical protein KAR39_12625, partial [Thermoplasmata archaeon]|nr:hypothetical protein [Thermoplasmata archaeon]